MKDIKILLLIISTVIIILSMLIIILYLNSIGNEEIEVNQITIENIENDISYVQGPLKQNIEDLQYNSIEYIHITDKQMAQKYFEDYRKIILNDLKQAYELLNTNYKKKRFGTYDIYEKFIKNNLSYFKQVQIDKIYINTYENSKEYIVIDQYGNTYIFKETAVMEYTVQLDDYTLENETFKEKYQKAEKKDRGILNIDKFFQMINMQDYISAYSLLDENFKQNYFKTQTEFETYMKTKFYRYNKVTYETYTNPVTNLYTYQLSISDATESNIQAIPFNVVIKLLEDTNFVMSFEVN